MDRPIIIQCQTLNGKCNRQACQHPQKKECTLGVEK
jgi:hypothetical protein